MMNTFIKYIKQNQKYANINKIVLTDNTYIECNAPQSIYKKRLSLYNLYLFKYGCGYYEKNFNFKLINDEIKHKLNLEKYKTITIDKEKVYLDNKLSDLDKKIKGYVFKNYEIFEEKEAIIKELNDPIQPSNNQRKKLLGRLKEIENSEDFKLEIPEALEKYMLMEITGVKQFSNSNLSEKING